MYKETKNMNEKIKELYVGQEFANYRRLCEFLEEKEKGGKSKICQINEFKRFFSFDKIGNKIIITQIYDIPKKKIDNRRGGSPWKVLKHPNLGVYNLTDEQGLLKGVYKIQLNNQVYIGSTTVGFKTRYRQHCVNNQNTSSHTQALLSKGASFDIIWVADENDSESIIRQKENDYIQQYKKNGYKMLNSNIPVIISEKRTVIPEKRKPTYKNIKINKEDYEKAIALLTENGLRIAL